MCDSACPFVLTVLPQRVSLCPLVSLYCENFALIFNMVAEQTYDSGPGSFATSFFCPVQSVTTTQKTTQPSINHITSSSGEANPHWSSKLPEESDIKMFTNDPKLNPRLPSPTSFDGSSMRSKAKSSRKRISRQVFVAKSILIRQRSSTAKSQHSVQGNDQGNQHS